MPARGQVRCQVARVGKELARGDGPAIPVSHHRRGGAMR